MDIPKKVATVTRLQKAAYDVFKEVTVSLEVGMTEVTIADAVEQAFKKRGIFEHWYNVPHNVFIGVERFKEGLSTSDYAIKAPSPNSILKEGLTVYIDTSPMDHETKVWGDWSSTIIFRPRKEIDDEQVAFLKEFREIQRDGITHITANTTGAEVANYYLKIFKQEGITLVDVRANVGHSMHEGSKDKTKRIWLDRENNLPLGEGIFTIEPGGFRNKKDGMGMVVARFEDCIYIPKNGTVQILGNLEKLPFTI